MDKLRVLAPTLLVFLGSRLFNWQDDIDKGSDSKAYRRIHHRSQSKLRRARRG